MPKYIHAVFAIFYCNAHDTLYNWLKTYHFGEKN